MSYWLYQINQESWSPERYRLEIWENERWSWAVGKSASKSTPEPGDVVVFFLAKTGGVDPGFYGWAIVTEWHQTSEELYFTPVAPSNELKMRPWWDNRAETLANKIRGPMKQMTLWPISPDHVHELRRGISSWVHGADAK